MNKIIFSFFLLLISCVAFAQTDPFAGTWQMEYITGESKINFTLQIATPEKSLLYPAHITIQCDSFNADYELLLVKKSARELAISKNKFARNEKPFSLVKSLFYLNGFFDLSRNLKGQPTLNINRIQIKNDAAAESAFTKIESKNAGTAKTINSFLKDAEIKLNKVNNIAWNSEYADRIISPSVSPAYFGLIDTIYIPTRDGMLYLSGIKKNDIASVSLNGRSIISLAELNKKPYSQDVILDTGLNYLVLYAENFANDAANKGKLNLECGKKRVSLDFTNAADSAASFIVVKLYFEKDRENITSFDDYIYTNDKPLKENQKLLGALTSTSRQLTLVIWDDAVEDGDTVSININGQWVAKGFPVKKNPQKITVTVSPGPNNITLVADNLGSIPPNTSIIEIIDGKKRKSFIMATELGEDNLIKVFYDLRAN